MNQIQIDNCVYRARRPRWWQTIRPFAFWSGVIFLSVIILGVGFVYALGVGK